MQAASAGVAWAQQDKGAAPSPQDEAQRKGSPASAVCTPLTTGLVSESPIVMPKSTPVPEELLAEASGDPSGSSVARLPQVEREHVQQVYDAIAEQWHGTRYKAWPRVVNFVSGLPPSSLVADLGCGNGKMAPSCREARHYAIGCDFSASLVRISALRQGMQAQVADAMALPYRSGQFDAALSIAVLHHVSSLERRRLLVAETMRVLRPGGLALFYAWAADQRQGRSGHEFPTPDVFVPWHQRVAPAAKSGGEAGSRGEGGAEATAAAGSDAAAAAGTPAEPPAGDGGTASGDGGACFDSAKQAMVFQRYCHVYSEGELRALVESVPGTSIRDEYYDTGNWCAVVEKVGG